ncbi:TetR/AcrR family transcriptional regulator [Nocardia huaxiensis]|uniref:TetR/AcrR family transcriptional regulator n=1 Tax=Nocardia huaxiensis TaxID=2755382 RepID=A0A7D6VAG0_9NOCA|nr:TetR/AcrR family transcriptional regulator [Nocardia huaxiensis]QLY30373.1 TetR/AcrR family transcriptional regulator [Nocardia huaxiensis]UFS95990.1 TetR/AcrR family transcriptional regulator [Nocardia huaxiensis]
MSETPSAARRSERARSAILAATTELIREMPYAKLGIEAIAARAGVGKQTIYRWWPSKGAVVLDAMLERDSSPEGLVLPDSGDIRADLTLLLRGAVAELTDPAVEGFLRAMYIEIQQDPDIGRYYRERLLLPQRAAVAARLAAAVEAGQLRPDLDTEIALDLLLGPIQSRWSLGLDGLTEEYADAILAAALAHLTP